MNSDPAIIEAAARALCDSNSYEELLAAVTPLIEAAALERAAKMAEEFELNFEVDIGKAIAVAIRTLKEQP